MSGIHKKVFLIYSRCASKFQQKVNPRFYAYKGNMPFDEST